MGQGAADPIVPTVEQLVVAELATPAMEEPLVTGPTLPRGGTHDDGDSGDEGLWGAMATLADPAGVGAEAVGDAPSNTAWDPPMVAEQMMTLVASTAEARLGQPIRSQQRPRRAPL